MLPRFNYFEPKTVNEACSLLQQYEDGKILAGGTDILVQMKNELITPHAIIDLKRINGIDGIRYDDELGLRIGSLATIRSIETNQIVRDKYYCLYQGAHALGSVQIRNRATLGGNLCHALPSGDMLPPLIALGATLLIRGLGGERSVSVEEFFIDVRKTILKNGEILAGIAIPPRPEMASDIYLKHTLRRAMDLAIVGVAISLAKVGANCINIRIALGAVAPTPIRAKKAEKVLEGQAIGDELIERAAEVASEECSPISDIRASAAYRRDMVNVLVKRALCEAIRRLED